MHLKRSLLVGWLLFVGCSQQAGQLGGNKAALSSTITVSGQARNAQGAPLPGATIHLFGAPSFPTQTTDVQGNYSFAHLPSGSYQLFADLQGCYFVPAFASLNSLSKDTIQNFDGAGPGCGGAPAGRLTISGEINDATGLPLAGVEVNLQGFAFAKQTTDAAGKYAFTHLTPGSYDVHPEFPQCHFLPHDADFDALTDNAVQLFSGSGPGCGGTPTVNGGATNGPLILSGHLRDSSGAPIVGGRVDLSGADQGIRFTDLTGAYSFHVNPGFYSLAASGACSFTPASAAKNVTSDTTQDFTASNSGCVTATQTSVNATGSVYNVRQGATQLGTTYVRVESRASASDTLARLQQIAAEQPTPSQSLTIAGNSAIERQVTVTLAVLDPDLAGTTAQDGRFIALTAAIATGSTVVRYESQVAVDASPTTIAAFLQADRNFSTDSLSSFHGAAPAAVPVVRFTPTTPPPALGPTVPGPLAPGAFGELEVAASETANAVVYATQSGPFVSTNGGQTVLAATLNGANPPPATSTNLLGDPSTTIGAPDSSFHQAIYFAELQQAAPAPTGGNKPLVAIGVYQSADNGQTFQNVSFPVNCGAAGAACAIPDQDHVTADRFNRAVTSSGSADQVYVTWRNYTSQTGNAHTIGVACSKDSGQTWTTDLTTLASTGADFARLVVGPDGSLLAAFGASTSGTNYNLQVQKWSSCASGFTPGSLTTIKNVTEVTDMPGIDRQVLGNYSVTFDDSDSSAQRVFAVYSNEATTGNDDVHVAESTDGANSFSRDSIINTVSTGRRYFPWICSSAGTKFVTWYDRRDSTTASPDLTAYYRSSVFDNGALSSVGIGTEANVSGVDDPQCASGFPGQVRGAVEEAQCTSDLPAAFIAGGTCQAACAAGATPPCGTQAPCDFRNTVATQCTTPGETCVTGGGVPKFGDYNGSACANGTLYVAWASSTPPPAATCTLDGLACTAGSQCCSDDCVSGTCAPSTAVCTPNGGACGPALPACCSAGLNGICQAGICLPAISMFTSSTCVGPQCTSSPVTITYHQVGGCNGFATSSGVTSVGPNAAYVIFGIESIDNSGGNASFAFNPTKVFVQQASPDFFDPTLMLYADILGPFAAGPTTVAAGQDLKFSVSAYGAAVVSTTNSDGAIEADQTSYFLSYNRAPSDPPVLFVKSDATQTSWPLTEDCSTIILQ
jgi:hypothetical protein